MRWSAPPPRHCPNFARLDRVAATDLPDDLSLAVEASVFVAAAPMVASGSVHEDANSGADNALSGVNLKLLNGCSPSGPKED